MFWRKLSEGMSPIEMLAAQAVTSRLGRMDETETGDQQRTCISSEKLWPPIRLLILLHLRCTACNPPQYETAWSSNLGVRHDIYCTE